MTAEHEVYECLLESDRARRNAVRGIRALIRKRLRDEELSHDLHKIIIQLAVSTSIDRTGQRR